jgi:hypothetical protein
MATAKPTTETSEVVKAKDYEITKLLFGNLVCQQCGEQRRTNENGVFCPSNDPECPRYADV